MAAAVSEIVETQFGFHIIQVTERQPERVTSYADASSWIREELGFEMVVELRPRRVSELREKAQIVYPEGTEPAAVEDHDSHEGHDHD